MRRALKRAVKEAQEMIGREKSLLRDLFELQGQLITVIHILTREMQAAINFGVKVLWLLHDWGCFRKPGSKELRAPSRWNEHEAYCAFIDFEATAILRAAHSAIFRLLRDFFSKMLAG